jgi:two-component system chemotaxis response regulator CheB
MGNDGVKGAGSVRAHGGRVLVQEESTCTVYGMPRAVAEAGLADGVHGLDDLPAAIVREVTAPPSTAAEGAQPQGGGTRWA